MQKPDEPINATELLARCLGDAAFVREILGVFHEQAKSHLIQLRKAIAAGDAHATRHVAHAMKGSAANIAAGRLGETCGRLEGYAIQGSVADAPALADAISTELDRCVAFFPSVSAKLDSN